MNSFWITLYLVVLANETFSMKHLMEETRERNDFERLVTEILLNSLKPYKCVAIICDEIYYEIFKGRLFNKFGVYLTYLIIVVEENEDLFSPYEETQEALLMANREGCQFYIILIANGIQTTRLLRFGDRYRVLNTRANFLLLYDHRLFHKDLHYLWKRIISVVFIREYGGVKRTGITRKVIPWFEISTVPFPSPIKGILVPRRLDIWRQSKFRSGTDLFRDKSSDLKNQTLRVITFAHVPATTKIEIPEYKSVRTIMRAGDVGFAGIEIEILQTISGAMNFLPDLYQLSNADVELWGEKQADGQYSGLIGEMVTSKADIALGDLHYTPYLLKLMDLSIPYNTECLTFLTPESLTSNSWKTLILPFTPILWSAILICLFLIGFIFYALSRFHDEINGIIFKDLKAQKNMLKKQTILMKSNAHAMQKSLSADEKYILMKKSYDPPKIEGEPEGLYLFGELSNSILYTYGMLLVVSLPKLPTGWSIRMLTGWYWLYCTLVVVAYKASMTAILANPAPRVTIDTLQELVDSKLPCGGRGEINREFFKTSLDPGSQIIGARFETVNDSDKAIDRIMDGAFAFYENVYFLKEASVKKELKLQMIQHQNHLDRGNLSQSNGSGNIGGIEYENNLKGDHNLHIMSDCVIHMPISIGLQKNSPIKPRVDKFIRRVFEAGLIKKWLDDVMQLTINAEIHYGGEKEGVKALMNLRKFFGAFVALFVGYFVSVIVLIAEVLHFQFVTKKDPCYDKYSKQIQVAKINKNLRT